MFHIYINFYQKSAGDNEILKKLNLGRTKFKNERLGKQVKKTQSNLVYS